MAPIVAVLCAAALAPPQFVNGRWFDGTAFREGAFYSSGGTLTRNKPPGAVRRIDLHGGYVVPPFGDAHNHFPESQGTLRWANPVFIASGVFYILNPNDIAELSNPIRPLLGTPSTVDVAFAHAGFTCPGGHPKLLYELLIDRKIYSYDKGELEGRAYYAIDSDADIERKWPAFLASRPDFVKIYLLYSERYDRTSAKSGQTGLRAVFVPELAQRAHAAGLRIGAHVESAQDFHAAVEGGVDLVMHLPGYHWRPGDLEKDYLIDAADIRAAATRKVAVVTTIDLAAGEPNELIGTIRRVEAENLRHLKDAGVTIAVGTDGGPGGILSEVNDLRATGVFSNAEILRMLTSATPALIFPHRRIGRLEEGYEASFLVLKENPLDDLSALKTIQIRVKSGEPVP